MKITWSGFRGENRALHPLLLAEGTGTLTTTGGRVKQAEILVKVKEI